nr:putative methyltransferase c1b3.06c [Quercus suber]
MCDAEGHEKPELGNRTREKTLRLTWLMRGRIQLMSHTYSFHRGRIDCVVPCGGNLGILTLDRSRRKDPRVVRQHRKNQLDLLYIPCISRQTLSVLIPEPSTQEHLLLPEHDIKMAQSRATYVPGYKKSHLQHHEWRNAENSAAYLLPILQAKAREVPELKLLDVGAGSGTITASLAKYMPHGQITATDLSDEILKSAATHAQKAGVANITFQTADIYKLPFPDNTFDVVHASMVLSHLDAHVDAFKEMLRVTKPGGVVANSESDLRMWCWYPELPGIAKMRDIQNSVHEKGGASSKVGPRLVSYAMQAGAKREQITMSFGTWTYSTPEERDMWANVLASRCREGASRGTAVREGWATEEDYEEAALAWEEWARTEDATFAAMHGQILVRKD